MPETVEARRGLAVERQHEEPEPALRQRQLRHLVVERHERGRAQTVGAATLAPPVAMQTGHGHE